MNVRGECGFSTAGRTLLCLTLTGVSGKSWLSCKTQKRRKLLGASEEDCNGSGLLRGIGLNMQIVNWLFKTVMFVFTLSRVPVRRIPTCCILLEVVTVLRKITRSKHKIGTSFKGTTHSGIKNVEQGYLIRNSIEPEFQTKRVSWARLHFQQPLSMR